MSVEAPWTSFQWIVYQPLLKTTTFMPFAWESILDFFRADEGFPSDVSDLSEEHLHEILEEEKALGCGGVPMSLPFPS